MYSFIINLKLFTYHFPYEENHLLIITNIICNTVNDY